ncbi:MAG: hypothetical protein WC058_00195, partial [Phycisphaeraceae bacterium]
KKATEQIKPPDEERHRDFWGNIKKNPIEPGELVNRKTCPWYMDDLEEQCAKFRGFLAFASGDGKGATEQWNRIPKLDATNTDAGDLRTNPNDYHRLMFGVEHGYLVAYPQDLALYEGRQKFAVLLGDFYYITQQFDKAVEICGRLLKADKGMGRLNSAQQDYVHYLCGASLYRGKWKAGNDSVSLAIREWDKILEHRDKTWSESRVAYEIGHLSRYSTNPQLRQHGEDLLLSLARSKDRNEFAYKAKFALALSWRRTGRTQESLAILKTLGPGDGDYYALAKYLIEHSEISDNR